MSAPDRDEEFETFLKRRTLLPNMAEQLEPPGRLDDLVLSEARKAIHAGQQPARAARWARPVALAATILLCLSIMLNVTLNTNRPAANSPRTAGELANRVAPAAGAAPPSAAPAPNAGGLAASPPSNAPAERLAEPAPAPGSPATRGADAPAASGSAQSYGGARARDETRRQLSAPALEAQKPAASEPDANGSLSAETARADSALAAKAAAPTTPPPADSAPAAWAHSGASLARSTPASASSADAGAPNGSAAPTPAAAQPAASESAALGGLDARLRAAVAKRKAEAANAADALSPTHTVSPMETAIPAGADKPHPADPKVWLQQIQTLRSHGKTAQADAEMQRFKAAFPTYPIPPIEPNTP
jgi:hypothetical protein